MKPKGLQTGSWVRVLTTLASATGESSYTLYDAKARPVRNFSTNYLGGYTQTDSNLHSFSGQLLSTETVHKRLTGDASLYIKDTYTYTPQDRLLKHTHKIGTAGVEKLMVKNEYDELGQLIVKRVGGTDLTGANPLQKVDYSYNILGWLKNINDINSIGNDLFAFQINYNDIADAAKKLYNGNISQTLWRTDNIDKNVKNYIYTYDGLNRLKDATDSMGKFGETLTYDKNGNIKTLKRMGEIVGGSTVPDITNPAHFGVMDDLTYTYDGGNRLQMVSDNANDIFGFKDDIVSTSPDTTVDYTYDANGNMLTDTNKGISSKITYNHLNLPIKIILSTGSITYIYNAVGEKLQKQVYNPASSSLTTTDYLDGYQYEKINTGTVNLTFFPTAEGYVQPQAGNYKYFFQYKDHLGNVRLTYQDKQNDGVVGQADIEEENNYYPFGMKQKGYNFIESSSAALKYKYNGKELQDELGLYMYDYGARNYDPTIGRWMNIDPNADNYLPVSPYNYVLNNPNLFVDPDGKDVYIYYIGPRRTWYNHATYYINGHTALGAKPTGYHNTAYGNLSGSATREDSPDSYYNEYGLSRYINERKTIMDYAKSGDVVIRMRVKLPKDVEEIIASYIANEAGNGRDQGGLWCTGRAKNILMVSLVEAGYSEDEADALIDKLMWYNSPEFPTAGEMLDAGFVGADYYFKNDENKVTHLNFDFGKTAKNKEDSKKKATGLSDLISDFEELSSGTYEWNGASWIKN